MIQVSRKDLIGNAIAWLLLGVVGGLLLDLCAKEILRTYSLLQFVLVRSLIAIAILLAIAPGGRWAAFAVHEQERVAPLADRSRDGCVASDYSSFTATSPSASETNSRYSGETKKAGNCPPLLNMIGRRLFQLTSPAWRPATCHDLTRSALTTLSKKSCSSTLTFSSARKTSANAWTVSAR